MSVWTKPPGKKLPLGYSRCSNRAIEELFSCFLQGNHICLKRWWDSCKRYCKSSKTHLYPKKTTNSIQGVNKTNGTNMSLKWDYTKRASRQWSRKSSENIWDSHFTDLHGWILVKGLIYSKKITTHPDIAHPFGNPPGQLWKESHYCLLVKVARGVFQRCVETTLDILKATE